MTYIRWKLRFPTLDAIGGYVSSSDEQRNWCSCRTTTSGRSIEPSSFPTPPLQTRTSVDQSADLQATDTSSDNVENERDSYSTSQDQPSSHDTGNDGDPDV